MSADRDVTSIVRSWLQEGVTALPDRVLDVLRVWQVAVEYSGLAPEHVHLVAALPGQDSDEYMIASRLLSQGILDGGSATDCLRRLSRQHATVCGSPDFSGTVR